MDWCWDGLNPMTRTRRQFGDPLHAASPWPSPQAIAGVGGFFVKVHSSTIFLSYRRSSLVSITFQSGLHSNEQRNVFPKWDLNYHKCFMRRGLQSMKPDSLDRSHMSNFFAYSAVLFIVCSLYRTPPNSMQGINHTWLHFANFYFKVTILQGLKNSFLTDDDFYTYFLPMHNLAHIEFALRDSQHRFWSCTASTA